jgi:ATP-binding cassette subfamily B protein
MKTQSNTSTNKKTLQIYWRFTREHRFFFWYATIAAIIAVIVADILPPLIISKAFDHLQTLFAGHQEITFDDLKVYFWLYIATSIGSLVLWRTQSLSAWTYMIRAEQKIMEHIFNHLQHLDNKFHSDRFGGALVSQTNKFVGAYDRLLADFNWNILTGITAFISSLAVLLFINFWYALVFIFIAVIYCVVLYWRMKKQMPFNRILSSSESKTTAKVADTITNVATVRSFAGEEAEAQLFHKQTSETRQAYERLRNIQAKNELISQSGTTIIEVVAFAMGIFAITVLHSPIGALYLTLTYTLGLTERLWQFMFIVKNINRAFGDSADMTEILQLRAEIQDPDQPEDSSIHRGRIDFKDVGFSYGEAHDPLFKRLSFVIKPGEHVGLVGHSGGGKSSLVQLLSRVMDINSGEILIDGQDIKNLRQRDLRKAIAYVPQEPLLFHRSLMENIRYGRPEATDEEVIAVAKMAHAHDFIEKLSEGYGTLVGERGVKLSGGQRQRVAIARAMLKNAPILVLDEATSALDSESEILIQDALWKLMEGRTSIVIAHRLSTIQKMDRIIVLEDGKIAEQGSHKELLAKNGTYAKLWAHQSGGFLEDDD